MAGATVAGRRSGLVYRNGSATTDGSGVARFDSPTTRATSGTFTFTVKSVGKTGYSYLPASNTETSDSIAR